MPAGRIFYVAPDDNRPIGGIRVIYGHVELLCRNGYQAYALHRQPGFRITWFDHDVPVMYASQLLIDRAQDVVVYPEIRAGEVLTQFPGTRKVVFNQGYFLTFPAGPFDPTSSETPYRHPDLAGVLVNSRAAQAYLGHVFQGLTPHRVRLSVDPLLYRFEAQKKLQIAFMPRRNGHDLIQILNVLKHRGMLHGVSLAPIENLSQADAAQVLRSSLFFLNVGMQEGFGLPAAEAMACGCVAVGYHGFGGQEFMQPHLSFPVHPGDVQAAATAMEKALVVHQHDPATLETMRKSAADFMAREYAPADEERDLLAAWRALLE